MPFVKHAVSYTPRRAEQPTCFWVIQKVIPELRGDVPLPGSIAETLVFIGDFGGR
jgi:hypothetical protein